MSTHARLSPGPIESIGAETRSAAPAARYRYVRSVSVALVEPLSPEDAAAQSMPLCSPAKWHLAHTTWFFERLVLERFADGFVSPSETIAALFNSYYNGISTPFPRPKRGLLTRPSLADVMAYRQVIDEQVLALLQGPAGDRPDLLEAIELGLRHEQQHQELILSDIKNLFSISPLAPAYTPAADTDQRSTPAMHAAARDVPFEEGIHSIGHEGDCFAFDHERPRHRVFIEPFTLSDRLVTAGQWAAFIDDHGYTRPELWLDAGWKAAQREAWSAPLYWRRAPDRDAWRIFTLTGEHDLAADDPVVHVSFFEADAFARWSGARLPTEHEWETAAGGSRADTHANLLEQQRWHTAPPNETGEQRLTQMYGDVWEWTRSDFAPYPGYRPPSGVLGEYNGKFMSGQYVLRGGCFATPSDHITRTYRNYYGPADRWCFAGVRLAKDAR